MADQYDVFLSHSSADKPTVEGIAVRLRDEAGLRVFLDTWHLVPGEPWMPVLERAIGRSTTVAVFFGPRGRGAWHDQESQLALVMGVEEHGKRVIPVLLPGARKEDVGGFMRLRAWVELEQDDGFGRLVAGVTGRAPGPGTGLPSGTGAEPTPVKPTAKDSTVDVLVITALRDELDALLKVTAGLREPWVDGHDGDYRIATFEGQHGPLRVAAARPTRMAGVATATVATRLADLLAPGCLAMCGVCAGHPQDTDLGDVVIADRVFHYDQGKAKPGAFEGDLWVHALSNVWLRAAQDLAGPAEGFHGYAVADDEAGQWWFIEQLLEGRDPLRAAALRRHIPDARRTAILRTLRDELGYVSFADGAFSLTDAGRNAGQERRVFHGTLVTERPYHIHVGPMGSGNAVVADGLLWERLAASQGMRKALAVEMEAASVGQVAHERSLPFVVVKGVMDRADQGKDDRFKGFAARASAEVLLGFLRRVVTAKVERVGRDSGVASRERSHGGSADNGHRKQTPEGSADLHAGAEPQLAAREGFGEALPDPPPQRLPLGPRGLLAAEEHPLGYDLHPDVGLAVVDLDAGRGTHDTTERSTPRRAPSRRVVGPSSMPSAEFDLAAQRKHEQLQRLDEQRFSVARELYRRIVEARLCLSPVLRPKQSLNCQDPNAVVAARLAQQSANEYFLMHSVLLPKTTAIHVGSLLSAMDGIIFRLGKPPTPDNRDARFEAVQFGYKELSQMLGNVERELRALVESGSPDSSSADG